MSEIVMTIMEIIGTVAFSISGALIAISCNLDVFGVMFIGVITAVGGGIVRDVFTGKYPPFIFSNTYILFLAACTAMIVFIIAYRNKHHFASFKEKIERINNVFDAIGLSAFTVTGTEMAFASGFSDMTFFVILMGMITGVGGGIFRDVLVSKTPYVLKKHIYALASLFGSVVYFFIRYYTQEKVTGTIIAMLSVFLIRMLATKYCWKLPKVHINDAHNTETTPPDKKTLHLT